MLRARACNQKWAGASLTWASPLHQPAHAGGHCLAAAPGEPSSCSGLSRRIRLLVMHPKGGTTGIGPDSAVSAGWQHVADPAGAQGTISDVILTAQISLSSLLHSLIPHIQIASSLQQVLWALSHRPALR